MGFYGRFFFLIVLCCIAAVQAACGSGETSILAPSDTRCAISLALNPASIPATGGTGTLAVTTDRECQWSASSSGNWVSFAGSPGGQGNGTVSYAVTPNQSVQPRTAQINVSGARAVLSQEPFNCTVTVTPSSGEIAPLGGELSLRVATESFCPWTAAAQSSWISLSPTSGTGPGEVTAGAGENPGGQRVGAVEISGRSVSVTQRSAAQTCQVELSTAEGDISSTGGVLTVNVIAAGGCGWTAGSSADWITVSPESGSGSAAVIVNVGANPGASRTGTVEIAGRTFTVRQEGASNSPQSPPPLPQPCTFVVTPLTFNDVAPGASTLEVIVTAASGCAWTANSASGWISVTSGASGAGNGTVRLTLQQNTGAARSGTVSVVGQTVTVHQLAAGAPSCSYSLAPSSHQAPAAGGSVQVTITTQAGCQWSVSNLPGWISAKPAAGTGSGSTTLSVAANSSSARSATLTIGGVPFMVAQAAAASACTYTLSPGSLANVSALGAATTVSVTASGSHCAWTVSGTPGWISVAPSSGQGSGQVVVTVLPNIGGARTATFQIAQLSFTVSQLALLCTYSVSPTSFEISSDGGTRSITVTTQNGCPVSAVSNVSWIVIDSAPTSGSGTITFSVAKYNGKAEREGTITITGQNYTRTVDVEQEERD